MPRQEQIRSGAVRKANQGHLKVCPVMYSWLGFTEAPREALLPAELESSTPPVTSRRTPADQEAFLLLRLTARATSHMYLPLLHSAGSWRCLPRCTCHAAEGWSWVRRSPQEPGTCPKVTARACRLGCAAVRLCRGSSTLVFACWSVALRVVDSGVVNMVYVMLRGALGMLAC